jgi:hypothetical protein
VSLNLGIVEFGALFRGSTGDEGRGTGQENNKKKLALNIEWYIKLYTLKIESYIYLYNRKELCSYHCIIRQFKLCKSHTTKSPHTRYLH